MGATDRGDTSARQVDPVAVVLGNLDLVRPLTDVGIRCAVAAPRSSPAFHSRLVADRIELPPDASEADTLTALESFGTRQPVPPVLFYVQDPSMMLVSRHRDRLAEVFRFVVDDSDRLQACADKMAFARLAERHGLPVPASRAIRPHLEPATVVRGLRYPAMLKPHSHADPAWFAVGGHRKALRVASAEELARRWGQLAATRQSFLLQDVVEGPETRIESYHAYVDDDGIVAAFTGRKIRTFPREFGPSTALETTDAPDVAALGAQVVERLGLRAVLKVDVKRDDEGRLWLLEVNPRFTLWNHLGAVAGVNLPALVYADLTGQPRPPIRPVRAGATWMHLNDLRAARAWGVPLHRWLRWAARCDARSSLSLDDPWVPVRVAGARLRARLGRPRSAAGGAVDRTAGTIPPAPSAG